MDVREDVFFRFAERRMPIVAMNYEEVTLEKVFLELTGDTKGTSADTKLSTEEIFGVETAPEAAEEQPETTPAESEKENESHTDGDYKPLFGGN